MSELLTVKQLAELLSTTPQSIRNQVSRGREGISVPPSFKLGARRVWLREAVMSWLRTKAGVVTTSSAKLGPPTKTEQVARRRTTLEQSSNPARCVLNREPSEG